MISGARGNWTDFAWALGAAIPAVGQVVTGIKWGTKGAKIGHRVYRVYGGKAGPYGRSWTRVDPNTVPDYRNAAGLPDANTGSFVIEGRLVDLNGVKTREALPLDGNYGGLDEVVVSNPQRQIQIDRVSGVNPPF